MVLRYFLVTTFLPPQGSFQGSSDLLSMNSEALAGRRDFPEPLSGGRVFTFPWGSAHPRWFGRFFTCISTCRRNQVIRDLRSGVPVFF